MAFFVWIRVLLLTIFVTLLPQARGLKCAVCDEYRNIGKSGDTSGKYDCNNATKNWLEKECDGQCRTDYTKFTKDDRVSEQLLRGCLTSVDEMNGKDCLDITTKVGDRYKGSVGEAVTVTWVCKEDLCNLGDKGGICKEKYVKPTSGVGAKRFWSVGVVLGGMWVNFWV